MHVHLPRLVSLGRPVMQVALHECAQLQGTGE